jgi:ribosomal protein L14E/L6E/L27E
MITKGQKVTKTCGRDKGAKLTVLEVIDNNYVLVKDEKGKEQRCNTKHLA